MKALDLLEDGAYLLLDDVVPHPGAGGELRKRGVTVMRLSPSEAWDIINSGLVRRLGQRSFVMDRDREEGEGEDGREGVTLEQA